MKFEFSPYIAVQVKDNDKAIDFYKRVLGMDFIEQKGNDTYLKSGPINFCIENAPQGAHANVFFEFKVENVKEARELLESEGCRVTCINNEKSIMFIDPYGMRFHVWEEGAF
jgi:catechol 2,3-dioxygenase-like lactoylglutathione lyase family enzyme